MNPMLALCLAAVLYATKSYICFHPVHKTSSWLIPVGLCISLMANFMWLTMARTTGAERLMVYGLVWDAMITSSTVLVPLLVFGVRLSTLGWIGMALVIVGIVTLRLS